MARFSSNLSFEELERMEREGNIGFRIPDNDTILNLAESQVQHPSISLSPNRSWLALYDSPKFIPFSQCKSTYCLEIDYLMLYYYYSGC